MIFMNRIKIAAIDIKNTISESFGFANVLLYSARSNVLYAILFIGVLLLLDWMNIVITPASLVSRWGIVRWIAELGVDINNVIGVKCVDYFRDILVMVAGVLGVILGLLFTTTISIIATKYSNISTAISSQVLEQYIMNKYFKLLARTTISSILFLFILVTGYTPTVLSVFIYTAVSVFSVAAFITFGQFSISYFDASRIVSDLISHNVKAMNRLIANNMRIANNEKYFKSIIRQSNSNIDKIALIIKESKSPQMSNTSFDDVSESLNDFAISYSKIKYLIPSVDGWHPKQYKHKRWSEISGNDEFYNVYKCNGLSLPHSEVADYLSVEKKVIDAQFSILDQMPLNKEYLIQIQNLGKYLQVLAYQCDIDLFQYFFDKLEIMIKSRLEESISNTETHQLVGLYIGLQVEYLIGAYNNVRSFITVERIKKLAYTIHHNNTNAELSFPYFVREWQDSYTKMLCKEIEIESCVKTPLFFTEYKLSAVINGRLQEYASRIIDEVYRRYNSFSGYLKTIDKDTEALLVCYSALNINVKVGVLIELFGTTLMDLNSLNYKDNKGYGLEAAQEKEENNQHFRATLLDELWDNGIKSMNMNDFDLHDIAGDIYHTLNNDITNLAFNDRSKFTLRLHKYVLYTIYYMQRVRSEHKGTSELYLASRLYPLIIDLFEINSIAIILFRLHDDNELEKSFWSFWNDLFTEQAEAASFLCTSSFAIYEYINASLCSIDSSLSIQRKRLILDYISKSGKVEQQYDKNSWCLSSKYVLTKGSDLYIDPIVSSIRNNVLGFTELPEVFVEYYLRTNILLKDNMPKLTQYGQRFDFERDCN